VALVLGASDGAEERRLAIGLGLATPEKIRTLQRKLYVKAKGDDTRSPGRGPGRSATGISTRSLASSGWEIAGGRRACVP